MVIGNGDLASALKAIDTKADILFFAKGVSNSQCKDPKQYERERKELMTYVGHTSRIVYFSSLSIFDKDTPYTRHKIKMETLIKHNFDKYCIVRLGNITWGNNPNTIINYFVNAVRNKTKVEIRDEHKYICDLKEFEYWLSRIPNFNCELNITGKRITAHELYNDIKGCVNHLGFYPA